jgi:hypothetical protein
VFVDKRQEKNESTAIIQTNMKEEERNKKKKKLKNKHTINRLAI